MKISIFHRNNSTTKSHSITLFSNSREDAKGQAFQIFPYLLSKQDHCQPHKQSLTTLFKKKKKNGTSNLLQHDTKPTNGSRNMCNLPT